MWLIRSETLPRRPVPARKTDHGEPQAPGAGLRRTCVRKGSPFFARGRAPRAFVAWEIAASLCDSQ
jgi:hypothetical protein